MPFFGGGTGDYFVVGTNIKGGNMAMPAVIGDNNMALGNGAGQLAINTDRSIAIGNGALANLVNAVDNIAIGYNSAAFLPAGFSDSGNIVMGANTLGLVTFQGNGIYENVILGRNALSTYTGEIYQSVVLGAGADVGGAATGVDNAIIIGNNANILDSGGGSIAIGAGSDVYTGAIGLGYQCVASNNAIAIGQFVNAAADSIVIGDASHTSVMIGGINIGNVSTGNFGANRLYTDDYFAAGVDSNSATVNGSAITAKLALWVDDGGTNMAGGGIGKADDTVATAGATWFLGRSRGTLAAPTIVQNGDLLGGVIALGNDGTDFATAARIDFEVDGVPGSNDMPGRIVFKVAPDGSQTVAEVARFTQDKYLRMAAGSLGIQFGGDTAAANALDDYEEGTFTPTFTCSTPGNLAVVYATQDGRYVKIGSLVTFSVLISCTPTFTTASGFIRVGGLPFTGIGAAPSYNQAGAIAVWNAPAGFVSQLGRISGTNYVTFLRLSNNGSANSSVSITEIPSATPNVIFITGSYEV